MTRTLNFFLFPSGPTKKGSTSEISTIVGVAAGIAVPIFIMCILVMVIICWIQKRQQKRQAEIKRTEAEMLKPLEEEALIPTGHTLKDLIDMSTGTMIYSCKGLVILCFFGVKVEVFFLFVVQNHFQNPYHFVELEFRAEKIVLSDTLQRGKKS